MKCWAPTPSCRVRCAAPLVSAYLLCSSQLRHACKPPCCALLPHLFPQRSIDLSRHSPPLGATSFRLQRAVGGRALPRAAHLLRQPGAGGAALRHRCACAAELTALRPAVVLCWASPLLCCAGRCIGPDSVLVPSRHLIQTRPWPILPD